MWGTFCRIGAIGHGSLLTSAHIDLSTFAVAEGSVRVGRLMMSVERDEQASFDRLTARLRESGVPVTLSRTTLVRIALHSAAHCVSLADAARAVLGPRAGAA
jgi:hypothetical protein